MNPSTVRAFFRTCLTGLVLLTFAGNALAAPDSRIADAAEAKDAAAVAVLIKQHADVNATQADGTTALHWAAHWDDLASATALIKAGATVTAANRYGVTPLVLACENGSARMITALLDAGADANVATTGEPPILVAARAGHADAVKALLARGADVHATEKWRGQDALMWAAGDDHADVVRLLVEHGANVNAHSPGGFSALLFAAREGAMDSVRVLLDHGAPVNDALTNGSTALSTAISALHYELAAYLIQRGADVNRADKAGLTPLHVLVQARNPGATAALRTGKGKSDSLELLTLLLKAGAQPNARTAAVPNRETSERAILIDVTLNTGGATPFLFAARGADVPAMRLLAAAGGNPNLPTLEGVTPLMAVAGVGYVETNDAGANTEKELTESLLLLLDLGADVNASSQHGQTALHGAVYRGIDSLISLLASRGASIDAKDQYDRTPLILAEQGFNNMGHYRREDQAVLLRKLYRRGK